jgi:cell division septum initiation protein DivIVA
VGGVVRQFAKGVQRGAAAGEAMAAAKTAATAVKEATEKNADRLIQDAIAKGMKTESVEFPMRWKDIPVDVAEEFAKTGIYPAGLSAADKAKILATRSKAGPVESIIQQPQN